MTALLWLGLSLSDGPVEIIKYAPIKRYSFPAHSPEFAEAQLRAELIQLLADSIDDSAQKKVDAKREQKIRKLLKEFLRKR